MKTQIILHGKKNKSSPEFILIEDYLKRLKSFVPCELLIEKDVLLPLEAIKKRAPQSYIIALHEEGKVFDSISFAQRLGKIQAKIQRQSAYKLLIFVLGPHMGFDRNDLKHADELLSLSPLTFPHKIASILLVEQLYRAHMILNKRSYHK